MTVKMKDDDGADDTAANNAAADNGKNSKNVKEQVENNKDRTRDETTGANKVDGAPMPDGAEGTHAIPGGDGRPDVITSAENASPTDRQNDPQVKTSHTENPPDFVDENEGLNVDSLNEAATVPVSKTGANSTQHGAPDHKAFAYRVAAWFSNIAHKLSEEEKKEIVRLKADLAERYDRLHKSGANDLEARAKELEKEAAERAEELKNKYLYDKG